MQTDLFGDPDPAPPPASAPATSRFSYSRPVVHEVVEQEDRARPTLKVNAPGSDQAGVVDVAEKIGAVAEQHADGEPAPTPATRHATRDQSNLGSYVLMHEGEVIAALDSTPGGSGAGLKSEALKLLEEGKLEIRSSHSIEEMRELIPISAPRMHIDGQPDIQGGTFQRVERQRG